MPDDWDSFIDGLIDTPVDIPLKASIEKRYPCGQCAGTGVYRGARIHQDKKHCFACKGKGYFKTDPRKLAKQREQRAKKREELKQQAQKTNAETGLLKDFAEFDMQSWNDFARSMIEQDQAGKAWSDKQVIAARNMVEKTRISREKRKQEREANAQAVDLQAIVTLFETAKSSGYKRPIYRAEGVVISLAPANGVNAGALYIKNEDKQYLGKVRDGLYYGDDSAKQALAIIAENPRDAAIRYGQRTGTCACCGRALTNHASIELGIGPVCATKWGLI